MRERTWPTDHPARLVLRGALALVLAAGLLVTSWLATPAPAFACSCIGFEGFADVADPQHIVVAGTAVARDDGQLTIGVERWFWGGPPQLVLVVDEPVSDLCNLAPNAEVGSRWLWVAFRPEFGPPLVNVCQPSWPLDGPDGAAILSEATEAFGGSAPPTAPAADAPTTPMGGPDPVILASIGAAALGGLAIFGSVAALARRRNDA